MNRILKSIFGKCEDLDLEYDWPMQIFGYPGELNSPEWSGPVVTLNRSSDTVIADPANRP
jgi:hypothetical protein